MLPITLKLKHRYNNNYNLDKGNKSFTSLTQNDLEIVSFPVSPAVIEYVKMYKESKLTVIHISDSSKKEPIEKSIYICRDVSTDIFNAEKIYTRTFDKDDSYLVHKVSKDLSTIAVTAKTKSMFDNIKYNRISLIKFQNNLWTYFNDVVMPPRLKYKNRYRLSYIMSFDHKGDHLAVLLSPKDKVVVSSRKGCGVVFQRKDNRYIYKGYFKYRTSTSDQDKVLLDIKYDRDTQGLVIKLLGNKEHVCNLITE